MLEIQGQMDGQTWTARWIGILTHGQTEGHTHGHGQTDGQTDKQTIRQTDGQMDVLHRQFNRLYVK
jgi:hypothetical protein